MDNNILNKYSKEMYYVLDSIFCNGQHHYSEVDKKDVEQLLDRINNDLNK